MSIAHTSPQPRRRSPMLSATKLFNRFVLGVAGTPIMPLYGVLEHRGRRSGRVFRTPVVVRPTSDGFMVPMPWGETTDWSRNVRAAGECVVRWKGRDYAMTQPELVEAANAGFGGLQQAAMSRLGIKRALHLRHR